MPDRHSDDLVYYPAYCFPVSPTYNTWARLTAADIHALNQKPGFEGQDIYFWANHPIKWVRLVGVLLAIDILPTRYILVLDDSSGSTVDIICDRPKPSHQSHQRWGVPSDVSTTSSDVLTTGLTSSGRKIDLAGIDLGHVVKAKGVIGVWRGVRQLALERIVRVTSTNEEAVAWSQNISFRQEILEKPWDLSEREILRAKNTAERGHKGKGLRMAQRAKRLNHLHDAKLGSGLSEDRDGREIERPREHEKQEREAELQRQLLQRNKAKVLRTQTSEKEAARRLHEARLEKEREEAGAARAQGRHELTEQLALQRKNTLDDGANASKVRLKRKREADRAERERVFAERTYATEAGSTAPSGKSK